MLGQRVEYLIRSDSAVGEFETAKTAGVAGVDFFLGFVNVGNVSKRHHGLIKSGLVYF
ncbi:MAG: hypothetical protein ACI81P_002587 [Neolewinella sp.]|jgi:hypothetical protein